MNLLKFDELSAQIKSAKLEFSASEWHGFVCGALAIDLAYPLESCVQPLVPDDVELVLPSDLQQQMAEVFEVVRSQMMDSNLEFELCLPDSDRYDLNARVNELAAWCDGFLYGLANAGMPPADSLSKDVQEILVDFSRISQLKESGFDDQDEEVDYNEIVEFVRMVALLIAEELQPLVDSQVTH